MHLIATWSWHWTFIVLVYVAIFLVSVLFAIGRNLAHNVQEATPERLRRNFVLILVSFVLALNAFNLVMSSHADNDQGAGCHLGMTDLMVGCVQQHADY